MKSMRFVIELDREEDGRWIADIPELNVLLYGDTRDDAIQNAKCAALEIIADRIARGELPVAAANPEFAVAA
jgi:predicted RNase H-like HicB family nuclease